VGGGEGRRGRAYLKLDVPSFKGVEFVFGLWVIRR